MSEQPKPKHLSLKEELDLVRLWQDKRDIAARDRLLLAYQPLCYTMAHRYSNGAIHIEDLAQDGIFGLMAALDRFDPDRGLRLGTYARWWIRAEIQQAQLIRSGNTGGMTGAQRKLMIMVGKARHTVIANLRREGIPEDENIVLTRMAQMLGVSLSALIDFVALRNVISLNLPVSSQDEQSRELIDLIPTPMPDAEQQIIEIQRRASIRSLIAELVGKLSPRECDILLRRYCGEPPRDTLEVIARDYSLTRERIRQIEVAALRKLATHAGRRSLLRKHNLLDLQD